MPQAYKSPADLGRFYDRLWQRLVNLPGVQSVGVNSVAPLSGLLRTVWDVLLRGEDDVPVAALDWYRQTLAEPDPRRQLALVARNSRLVKARIGPLLKVIRSAAPVDTDMAALWELIESDFHANQGAIVAELDRKGALRPGLDAASATDILWTLNHPDVWHLLADRGWTPEQWEIWFAEAATQQLLGPDGPVPRRAARTAGRGTGHPL